MALVETQSLASCSQTSLHITRTSGSNPSITHQRHPSLRLSAISAGLSSYLDGLHIDGVNVLNTLDSMTAVGLVSSNETEVNGRHDSSPPSPQPQPSDTPQQRPHESVEHKTPFHKWMKTLHRRAQHRPRSAESGSRRRGPPSCEESMFRSRQTQHRKSSSGSSYGFVAAVKSASVSLASASAVTRPRKGTGRSHGHTKTERSSRASFTATRFSEDSGYGDRPVVPDPAAADRSMQRRRILEELISTEEGYIRDVRFLMNVSLPHTSQSGTARRLTTLLGLCYITCLAPHPSIWTAVLNQPQPYRGHRITRGNSK